MERRRSVRVECDLTTTLRELDPVKHVVLESAVVKNLSQGGIRLQVTDFIPTNSRLQVFLHLPDQQTMELRIQPTWIAEIPHLNRYELGARFVEMSENQESIVESYQKKALLDKLPPGSKGLAA